MDEQLQSKIDEARAAGYSDEEIQNFLASKDQPIPQEQPIDRSGEYGAVAQQLIPDAVKYGAEGLGLAYAGKKVIDAVRGGPVAPQPTQPSSPNYRVAGTGATPPSYNQPVLNETWDAALKQQPKTAPAAPSSYMSSAQSIVQKLALDKVLKNAGAIGAGMSMAQGLFGTSDDEIRIMKEAEARKRAQGWKPLNER